MEKHSLLSTPDPMEQAITAFDALASDPTWMALPLTILPLKAHPANALELTFYQGGKKLGARMAASHDRQFLAQASQGALADLVAQTRQRAETDERLAGLSAQTQPAADGATLLIEASGASFIAGFLEGGLLRENQEDADMGFGRALDGKWMQAKEQLSRGDEQALQELVAAENQSSKGLSDFFLAILPDDGAFKAGAQMGLFGHVGFCPRQPEQLGAMRSMNRDPLGRFFQAVAIATRLGEKAGADLGSLMGSGLLRGDRWDYFTQLWGGFPSKKMMLAEAQAALGALSALSEAQEIGASSSKAVRLPSAPSL